VADQGGSGKKVKVVDRRWLTADGELRADRPGAKPSPERREKGSEDRTPRAEKTPPPEGGETDARADGGPGTAPPRLPKPDFLMLVEFLAQQAAVFLSGAQGVPKNPAQAKVFIDLLDVLQEKTKNNLTDTESRELANVLFQLHTLYVQTSR
jgi:Domain of unknown function (DUF1844).